MASVREIEREIAALPPGDLAELRAWFDEYDAAAWDRQLEEDARSGKLDAVAEKAIRAHVNSQQRLRRLKGKVRWEGNLEEMRRD